MTSLLSPSRNLLQQQPLQQGENALYHSLKKLPRRAKQVFLYSRLDGLGLAAIAQRMGLAPHTVSKDMRRVLEHCSPHGKHEGNQAIAWYVRLQSPDTTASERIDFRRWLDADTANLNAFHATEMRWRQLLAPARLLGAGQWYHKRWGHMSWRAWAGLAALTALLAELAAWI
jgi:hypothetical protein